MNPAAVSDTSPVVFLNAVGLLPLLRDLFESVYIPEAVARELSRNASRHPLILPDWIVVRSAENRFAVDGLHAFLGDGEAEAIVLAKELRAVLLVDDARARKTARACALDVIGTIGIIGLGAKKGFITSPAEILERLRREHGMWLSEEVFSRALKELRRYGRR